MAIVPFVIIVMFGTTWMSSVKVSSTSPLYVILVINANKD